MGCEDGRRALVQGLGLSDGQRTPHAEPVLRVLQAGRR